MSPRAFEVTITVKSTKIDVADSGKYGNKAWWRSLIHAVYPTCSVYFNRLCRYEVGLYKLQRRVRDCRIIVNLSLAVSMLLLPRPEVLFSPPSNGKQRGSGFSARQGQRLPFLDSDKTTYRF